MKGQLEKNISSAALVVERALANERWCRSGGFLQSVDARAKTVGLFSVIVLCSLAHSIPSLLALYALAFGLAAVSRIGLGEFTRRVWVFIPLFTGAIAIPALFLTPGRRIAGLGPVDITREGLTAALMLLLRVSTSISFALLLVLTTPWNAILGALRSLRVPEAAVSLLALSYRYMLLLLRTLSELFMARRSRVRGKLPRGKQADFLARSAGFLFLRSIHIAEGVHMAMISRGGMGSARPCSRIDGAIGGRRRNLLWILVCAAAFAAVLTN